MGAPYWTIPLLSRTAEEGHLWAVNGQITLKEYFYTTERRFAVHTANLIRHLQ